MTSGSKEKIYRNDFPKTSKSRRNTHLKSESKKNNHENTNIFLGIVNHHKPTTTLDISNDNIVFVSSVSFITEIEEILDKPLKIICIYVKITILS